MPFLGLMTDVIWLLISKLFQRLYY